jgi:hypothetical protein
LIGIVIGNYSFDIDIKYTNSSEIVELLVFRSHFLHPRLQETGRKGIIASRTFCSLAIEEMSPGFLERKFARW